MLEPSSPQGSASTSAAGPRGAGAYAPLIVECLNDVQAEANLCEWRKLAETCVEPNIFLDPDFALPAARHVSKAPRFLFVWESEGEQRKLVGLCPLAHASPAERLFPARIWTHKQAPLGTPLFAPGRTEAALAAIFTYCKAHLRIGAGILFPALALEGKIAQLLTAGAAADGREIRTFDAHQRACLHARAEPQHYLDAAITSKRRRNLKRAKKLLEAQGALTFQVTTTPEDVRTAIEAFLDLEAKGWKGQRGTAFLKSLEGTAFVRDVAAKLSIDGKYIVVSLSLDKKPVAMGLVLKSGDRAFWWKIAYDEAFATYSPGVLLTLELTRLLLSDTKIALTDSCANANHPMIDHIWSDRIDIADLLIAVEAEQPGKFAKLAQREAMRRAVRGRLKTVVLRLRQWRRSRAHAHG